MIQRKQHVNIFCISLKKSKLDKIKLLNHSFYKSKAYVDQQSVIQAANVY